MASILLITMLLIAGMVGCAGDGDGGNLPPSENLEIRNWYDLDDVRNNLAGNHTLVNDLDSTTDGYEELAGPTANEGKGWQPIGFWNPWSGTGGFAGTFDGQGHEIRDLFIDRSPHVFYVGLFGFVDERGVIQNIGVVNAHATGSYSVSGLVGECYGTVSNSYFTGNVTGEEGVGGLVGANGGTVSNSYYNYDEVLINGQNIITIGALFDKDFEEWLANDKFLDVNDRLSQEGSYYVINNVTDFQELLAFGQNFTLKFRLKNDLDLSDEPNFYIPYLAGEFDGNGHKISNLSFNFDFISDVGLFGCLFFGGKVTDLGIEDVNITGYSGVGGLVGGNAGIVSYCHSTGNVTGEYGIGGLVGDNDDTVSNSYSTGNVTGTELVGGLVGANWHGAVDHSYSSGSVTGTGSYAGGLVGYSGSTVTVSDSYSTGKVTGKYGIGGLVGRNSGTVDNSYSTGSVSGDNNVGGLVAANDGTVSNSFWDTQTSGQATSGGGTGKTTAEMQDIATFSGAGWDIITVADSGIRNPSYIWNIVNAETYPFLSWQS